MFLFSFEEKSQFNHASSITKEQNYRIIVSNFVNSLFEETKNDIMNSKIKIRNISSKQCFKNTKPFSLLSNKKIISGTLDKNNIINDVKDEYNISNKCKRTNKESSNISCDTRVSTFEKENRYVKPFNTNNTNKKKDKKINIQSDDVASLLCTQYIYQKKPKANYILNEKFKLMKRKQELTDNKILFFKHKPNKTNNNSRKEKDILEKVFTYDNNRKRVHEIKKPIENENKELVDCNKNTCSKKNKIYKHIVTENKPRKIKKEIKKVHIDENERTSIQKIKISKVYNKKVIFQMKKNKK